MANTDAPFGMRPIRHLTGGAVRADALPGGIVTGYARSIYYGDPVKLASTGVIQTADSGDLCYGTFAGCEYTDSAGKRRFSNYWPSGTTATDLVAYVYRDPNLTFEIQCNSNFSVADIGANCDILYTSGTTIGYSRVEAESEFVSSTRQLRVLDLIRSPGNDTGTHANIEVKWNEHQLGINSSTGV